MAFVVGYWIGKGAFRQAERASRSAENPAEFDAMRLEMDEMYDKLHHLYDRTRKRLKVEPEPAPTGSAQDPEKAVKVSKQTLREVARAKGLWPTVRLPNERLNS